MATVYIANSNTSFEKAFLFNGYLPTTHSGLNDTINEVAPLDVDALIFGGDNDVFIFGVEELEGVYGADDNNQQQRITICHLQTMRHMGTCLHFSDKEQMEPSEMSPSYHLGKMMGAS